MQVYFFSACALPNASILRGLHSLALGFPAAERLVSVVANRTGCFKYSVGVCATGAIDRRWNSVDAELVETGRPC